ncbi:MAG: alanyl-tRNA editing protein [Erysipelotrichaceae bacterium]|nr:alanyl-tRNA editing protein [Erysipelotrichaceae bacterium]
MEMNELFYKDPYLTEFDAEVLSCDKGKKDYEVILSDTAFYPEGGGQPADHGMLGDIPVVDVKRDKEDRIIHHLTAPLEEGITVHGIIDWERRFDHMQNHTGEHIVSGLIHQKYGYENVGFHLSDNTVLVDFDGFLTPEQLAEVEMEANELIWRNVPVQETFPTDEELEHMEFRSKKELSGKVRIIEVPGGDICACCGTHVMRTGEIGLIKIIASQKNGEGVRAEMMCGKRALSDYIRKNEINARIYRMFAAKPYEAADAVVRLKESDEEKGRALTRLARKYFTEKSEHVMPGTPFILEFEEGISANAAREYASALVAEKGVGTAAVLMKQAENRYSYMVISQSRNLRDVSKEINTRLNGRGGGKPDMIQGSLEAEEETIREVFTELFA